MVSVMPQVLRFVVGLVLGLALLTWGTFVLVQTTMRTWIEKDVRLRAELAVSGARQALSASWRADRTLELRDILTDITRDERIMAAGACDADAYLITSTAQFPAKFTCDEIWRQARVAIDVAERPVWHWPDSLPGGPVMVSAIPVSDGGLVLGYVVLVHDLSFADRRDASTRRFILIAFTFLAVAASIITMIVARLTSRSW
ncbi:MAG: hypothetical protein ACREUU_02950, partial [Gammaproteobacteria bacterium]